MDNEETGDSYREALGGFVMAFNRAESALVRIISDLIGDNSLVGEVVAAPYNVPSKIGVAKALAKIIVPGDDKQDLRDRLARAADSFGQTERNSLIHGQWIAFQDSEDSDEIRMSVRNVSRNLRASWMPQTLTKPKDGTKKLLVIEAEFDGIAAEIRAYLRPNAKLDSFMPREL